MEMKNGNKGAIYLLSNLLSNLYSHPFYKASDFGWCTTRLKKLVTNYQTIIVVIIVVNI